MYPPALFWRERRSDSPLIESVWACHTPHANSRMVVADPCIAIALIRTGKKAHIVITGPRMTPYSKPLTSGYSCTTIRLKVGVFLKRIPAQVLATNTLTLPADANGRFWLEGTRLQFPEFEQSEQLIEQLLTLGLIGFEEPQANAGGYAAQISLRTQARQLRRITGLSPYKLYQIQRMYRVLQLMKQGMAAVDVASELGFVDQAHLTRVTKQFFGRTPKQLPKLPQLPL